jgi:protein TonB
LRIEDSEADDKTLINVAPVISAPKAEEEEESAQVFFIVEDMPEFPGGEMALRAYIANAIKYPVIAQENGIQGKVYVTFVVGRDGKVTNATIARGVDPSIDKEALRVVNSLPTWKPGKQRGKPVNVSYTVPINFVLQ